MTKQLQLIATLSIGLILPAVLSGCDLVGSEEEEEGKAPTPPDVVRVDDGPAWSPDGTRIAYHHDAGRTEDTTDVSGLYVRNLETDSTQLLAEGPARSPDWRPDGERIGFTTGNIYTIRPDGSDLRRVTNHGSAFFPSWAPSGTRIAYDATSLPQKGIWLVDPDGTNRKHLGLGRTPDWNVLGRTVEVR